MTQVVTEEDALLLAQEYCRNAKDRLPDERVVALAKAYVQLVTLRDLSESHWQALDHELACLKRALR